MNMLVVGKTGSGKTIFVKNLIKNIVKPQDRLIWISNDRRDINVPDVLSVDRTDILYRLLFEKYPHVGIEMGFLSNDEVQAQMDRIAYDIWHLDNPANTFFVIDEASEFYARASHSVQLERLIRAGRKRGISVIMATQMIIDLDLTFLKQCSYLVVFALSETNDREKVAKNLSLTMESLEPLSVTNHRYLIKNMRTGEISYGLEKV